MREAGLAVLRGEKILMNASCAPTGKGDQLVFGSGLISFGPAGSSIKGETMTTGTSMLKMEDADNSIETLYGNKN